MGHWITSWSYIPIKIELPINYEGQEQVVRIRNNVEGERIRVTLSNEYGVQNIKVKNVFIGKAVNNDKISNITNLFPVYFNGSRNFYLKSGENIISDEINLSISDKEDILIKIVFYDNYKLTTGNFFIIDQKITTLPNLKADDGNIYLKNLEKVEIESVEDLKTIVAFGDSITNDSKWTAPLTEKLYRAYPRKITLINAGIYGNRLLHDSEFGYCFGKAGIKRFERDVFEEHKNVKLVIVLEGINDIIHPLTGTAPTEEKVEAEDIINALKFIINIAHKNNSKILLGTITPFYNYNSAWNETEEEKREKVNSWIRNNELSDGFIDFDMILRDPSDLKKLYYEYDSGDNLHLSIQGGKKVSESINIKKLYELCMK